MIQIKHSNLLEQVNDTEFIYDKQKTIHQMFEEQVYLDGNSTAARYHNECITYQKLNERANQLARRLRTIGIKPNMIVGLMVNRSLDMLIGMLGILKAGGCYLPIDPKFPISRINHMLKDSETKILLTQHSIQSSISQISDYSGQVIFLDDDIYHGDVNNLENWNQGCDLAYVIYTSGSTGTPKGVMLEHQSVHNFIVGMLDKIEFQKEKKIVSLTTISFDIFVLESLLPLTLGMEIVIADPMTFAQDMKDYRVQMLQTTPSTMQLILNDEKNHIYMDTLTDIMLGGEAFPSSLLTKLKKITNAKIYNMYGPTETTVWSMVKELTSTDFITVGYPITNTQIFLIDDKNNIMSVGEEGEICIAGDGLAKGYLNREELTKERFIENKLLPGIKMYRTGDLGRWLENGEIEFLGRIDSQVKIRGFRIELGEIEAALLKLPEISDCVVAAKANEDGDKFLVAYYVSGQHLVVSDIISYLKTVLPEYEVPGIYMNIEQVPLTPNGKINRLALPDPKLKRPNLNIEYVKPRTKKEVVICDIWKMLLGYDVIGVKDNFFDLGGNSILVSQLHVELEKRFLIKLDIADLFTNNTISSQCVLLDKENELINKRLKTIHFFDQFYTKGINSMLVSELQANIYKETSRKIEHFAKLSGINTEAVYLSLFMFLLSGQISENEIGILCRKDTSYDFNSIHLDLSLFSDLEQLCRRVYKELMNTANVFLAEYLKNNIFNHEHDIFMTFYYNCVTEYSILLENEIRFEIAKAESEINVKLIFNSDKLNKREMSNLLDSYLRLIETVIAEIE